MRLTGTENVRIIGIPKNGSQSIKRIGKDNPNIHNWEVDDDVEGHKLFDPKEYYNKNLTLIFPVRDEWSRIKSEFIQSFRDHLELIGAFSGDDKELMYKRVFYYIKKEFLRPEYNIEKVPSAFHFQTKLNSRLNYSNEPVFKFWIDNIYNNPEWKGMKLIFIDLASLRKKSFIPWLVSLDKRFEGCTVPDVNVTNTHKQKKIVLKAFYEAKLLGKYLDYERQDDYEFNVKSKIDYWYYIWSMIKNSKYYKKI